MDTSVPSFSLLETDELLEIESRLLLCMVEPCPKAVTVATLASRVPAALLENWVEGDGIGGFEAESSVSRGAVGIGVNGSADVRRFTVASEVDARAYGRQGRLLREQLECPQALLAECDCEGG